MISEHLTIPVRAIGMTTAATRRSSRIRGVPQTADGVRTSGTKSQRGEEEVARFECSTGRRCGENTLGERVKGIEKWRDIENVQKLDKIRSEGLEVWDEVSHFNAKKAYLLQAR